MRAEGSDVDCAVERVELARIAGKMIGAVEYLRNQCRARSLEGSSYTGLADKLADLTWARDRIIELSEALPEGLLEAFAREHPLFYDQLDGPYCGYGSKEGKPYTCPVRDLARHWDAWELMGTRHRRPEAAIRG